VSRRAGAERPFGDPLPEDPWPVAAKKLLTERERSLYQRLLNLYPHHKIFIQVALSQLVDVDRKHPERQSIRSRYKQLVADFVLCRADLSVVTVIELDDHTHEWPKRKAADARKNKALADAGIRLVRIPAGRIPSEEDLRALITADGKPKDVPREEIVLSLAEETDWQENSYDPERESSEVSRELKRVALKAAYVVVLVLGGWFIFSFLLPGAIKLAFAPLATPQARAAAAPPRSMLVALPQMPTAPIISVRSAEELAERRRVVLQEAATTQRQKDHAWTAFYSTPTSCEHPVDWSAQVECGNQYIRAKKRFEEQWARSQGTAAEMDLRNESAGGLHK
jgi:very-short-patch-repair endonuclease